MERAVSIRIHTIARRSGRSMQHPLIWIALLGATACATGPEPEPFQLEAECRSSEDDPARWVDYRARWVRFDGSRIVVEAPDPTGGNTRTRLWQRRLTDAERAVLVRAIEQARDARPAKRIDSRMPEAYALRISLWTPHAPDPLQLRDIWDPRIAPLARTIDAMLPASYRLRYGIWRSEAEDELEQSGRVRIRYTGGTEAVVARVLSESKSLCLSIQANEAWTLTRLPHAGNAPEGEAPRLLRQGDIDFAGRLLGLDSESEHVLALLEAEDTAVEGPVRIWIDGARIKNR
jgi:hypothetical protein